MDAAAAIKQRADARGVFIHLFSVHDWPSGALLSGVGGGRSPALHNHFRYCRRNGEDLV